MSKPPALACLSYDKWIEAFKPITNTTTPDSAFDGTMYETYGADVCEVRIWADGKYRHLRVWSLVENDDGDLVICDGYHHVNRIGYFLTEAPAVAGVQYIVTLD
jgi:hypothetical protein